MKLGAIKAGLPDKIGNSRSGLASRGAHFQRAFTLVELMVTLFVIAIFIALGIKASGLLIERGEGVRCAENLRSLHVSFATYIQDQGHWPQQPLTANNDSTLIEKWWIWVMKPYGATAKVWQCPTIQRLIAAKSKDGEPTVDYMPTQFDSKPGSAYRWPNQPWLVEIGNMHGHGALIDFPDGSVKSLDQVIQK